MEEPNFIDQDEEHPSVDKEPENETLLIGRRITEALRNAKMTQQALADALGLSLPAVKKLASGNATIQYAKLKKLALALDTTPNQLLGFNERVPENGFIAATEGALRMMGLDSLQAAELAQLVCEVAEEPIGGAGRQNAALIRRAISESATRRFLRSKRPQSGVAQPVGASKP
jgi:transcriptional regulator with XRE-family HTH domain